MSICGRKKSLLLRICGFLFILTLCLVLHYWKKSRDWGPWNENAKQKIYPSAKQKSRPGDFCKGQLANGTITPLPDRHSFIITPYSDRRQGNLVRVLSIIHHQKVKELYCIFCCENSQEIQVVQGEIDFHRDRFDFPYGTADLLCLQPEDCKAHFISVHPWNPQLESTQLALFPIRNLFPEKPPLDFTICISTMFGKYDNVLQFVQSMELYRLLGVQKVTIYKNSCSPLMEKVLDYYISQGIVEIIPWPIDLYLNVSTHWHYSMERKDLGYYGQIAALNDCIYHNMFKSKYLLLIDPDEFILPVKDRDWKSLMDRLEKEHPGIGVFLFENQVFRRTVFSKTPFNFSSWAAVPGFNVFEHIHKEPNDIHSFNNMKMILDPTRVIQTSVHSVLKQHGTSIQVLNDLAFNFHCRILERTDVRDRDLIRDPIFWRYNKTLIPKVNDVLLKSGILAACDQQHQRNKMPRFKSKMIWMPIPFLILLFFEMYPRRPSSHPAQQTQLTLGRCRGELVNGTITALKHNKTFVVSLYHDNRQQNLTRAIAMVHYKKIQDLYCWFCCSHNNRISIIRASVDIHPERFGLPVGGADIVCLEPHRCLPQYMSIHPSTKGSMAELPWFEINNRVARTSFVMEYTVCLSVMPENYDNALQFVQSVEMYKALGAKKVYLYKMNCSSLMDQILHFYVEEGTVEVIPWPITSYVRLSSFWYSYQDWGYGKTTVLNDCIYRNMYRSKYVVFNDFNEIILPLKHPNWKMMIDSLEDQNPGVGIFFFESHFFSQNVFSSLDKFNSSLWKTIPGVNILRHVYREPNKLHINILKKMIVNPRSVVQASSHSVLKGYGRTLEVSRDVAILYNCRKHLESEFGEQYLMRDTTIWRFNLSLISNVNKVFDHVLGNQVDNISIWSIFLRSLAKIF